MRVSEKNKETNNDNNYNKNNGSKFPYIVEGKRRP